MSQAAVLAATAASVAALGYLAATDPKRMAALKSHLMAALEEVEAAAPKLRANLQKARASVAR